MLVAFVMLLGPESFHSLSQADMQYANLNTASWANGDTTITYTYDANGSVETKTTVTSSIVKEVVTYHYNLAGRLDKVTTDDQAGTEHVVEYIYNDEGIRVQADSYDQPTGGGTKSNEKTVTYLVDSYNHTGYAQVLEEWAVEGSTATLTCYTLGDDVIAQKKTYWQFISPQWELQSTGYTQYLLYDGHGSTRQLAEYDTEVSIADSFSYDGYGVLLQDKDNFPPNGAQDPGKVAQQATSLLYAGEHFDTDSQNYYLRARWYDSLSGRFNRMDPFAGNNRDPQSLHKYLYAHCNPINGIDPGGLFLSISEVCTSIAISVSMSVIFDIAQGERNPKVILLNALISAGLGLIAGPLLSKVSKALARGLLSAFGSQFIARSMQILLLGGGRALLGTISYIIKFKIKHGRVPSFEECKFIFLANLTLALPLAWVETGGIERIGRTLADNAQGCLDDLQEKGFLELAEQANPDSIFRARLLVFLSTNLPQHIGTALYNIQEGLAQTLVSVLGALKFSGESETQ